MALDPMSLLSMAGALGGGSTKVSQSSNNTSNAVLSFSNVSNIGGGVNANPASPISTPQTTTATATASGSESSGGSFLDSLLPSASNSSLGLGYGGGNYTDLPAAPGTATETPPALIAAGVFAVAALGAWMIMGK
jgi:hypothetical protein